MPELTTYTITTTLLDDDSFYPLCNSLKMFFPYCQPVQRQGNGITIYIGLDEWNHYYDDYFDEKKDDGIIGDWKKATIMASETYLISKYEEDDLPDLDFKKFGRDGNIFAIVGTVTKALRISDLPDKDELIKEVQQRVTSSHSYADALNIAQEYVNLIDTTEDEEEEDDSEMRWDDH